MDWSVLMLWEWQVMMVITAVSAGMAWWRKGRIFQVLAIGGTAVLILSISLWEPSSPLKLLPGIILCAFFLLWMAKIILEPLDN